MKRKEREKNVNRVRLLGERKANRVVSPIALENRVSPFQISWIAAGGSLMYDNNLSQSEPKLFPKGRRPNQQAGLPESPRPRLPWSNQFRWLNFWAELADRAISINPVYTSRGRMGVFQKKLQTARA